MRCALGAERGMPLRTARSSSHSMRRREQSCATNLHGYVNDERNVQRKGDIALIHRTTAEASPTLSR